MIKVAVKVVAIVMMCFGYYLLMPISVSHMVKHIKLAKGKEIPLLTSGIYGYVRHPMYLSIDIAVLGTFLILPNLLSLMMAIGMITSLFGVSLCEEKVMLEIYRDAYREYMNRVPRYIGIQKARLPNKN